MNIDTQIHSETCVNSIKIHDQLSCTNKPSLILIPKLSDISLEPAGLSTINTIVI